MKNTPTKLTLKCYDVETTWEVPYSDITLTQLIKAFYGLCVTHTFSPEGIINEMDEFVKDYKEVD